VSNESRDVKFAEFDRMLAESKDKKVDELRVASPQVLGDNYEELVENLNRIADAGIALVIVPRSLRG